METFFLTPEMFDNYITFDPFTLNLEQSLFGKDSKEHLANFLLTEKRIWFAGSNAEDVLPYTEELAKILKTENRKNIKWKFSDEPKEKHTTILEQQRKAIIWTLNKTELKSRTHNI